MGRSIQTSAKGTRYPHLSCSYYTLDYYRSFVYQYRLLDRNGYCLTGCPILSHRCFLDPVSFGFSALCCSLGRSIGTRRIGCGNGCGDASLSQNRLSESRIKIFGGGHRRGGSPSSSSKTHDCT